MPNFSKDNQPEKKKGQHKTTKALSDAIMEAANTYIAEGNKIGLVAFLQLQMSANPVAFMGLLKALLPRQVNADIDASGVVELIFTSPDKTI